MLLILSFFQQHQLYHVYLPPIVYQEMVELYRITIPLNVVKLHVGNVQKECVVHRPKTNVYNASLGDILIKLENHLARIVKAASTIQKKGWQVARNFVKKDIIAQVVRIKYCVLVGRIKIQLANQRV